MLPSSSEIKYFLEVSTALNISRAAERLGISQPSLSLAIQRLEESVGTDLLVRSKSGVKLTKAGEKFALQARTLIEEWERLKGVVSEDEEQISGRFTIGCHPSVALYSLQEFVPDLMSEYPALEIGFFHDLSRKVTESVISFRTDFGIVVNPVRHPDLVIKPLMKDEVTFWVGSEKTRLNDPKSEEAVIICDEELHQTQSLLKAVKKAKIPFKRVLASTNLEVIASLVSHGAGLGILPGRVATRIQSQGLKKAGPNLPVYHDEVCLVFRADAQKSKASKVIIDTIRTKLK
jgi:LysR family transcriptional regulator, cell division regulator